MCPEEEGILWNVLAVQLCVAKVTIPYIIIPYFEISYNIKIDIVNL